MARDWRVLVVEDDRGCASLHCRIVADKPGFTVLGVASTAAEGRTMAENMTPDLLLLDLGLPGDSGLRLLRHLRARGRTFEAIAVTAHSSADCVRAAMQLGVVDYLVKPFQPVRLERGLERFDARMQAFASGNLHQATIDDVRMAGRTMPKDISARRLDDVHRSLVETDAPMTADEVASRIGVSRVTARRYLEYLVESGQATVGALWGGAGRPPKAYELLRR